MSLVFWRRALHRVRGPLSSREEKFLCGIDEGTDVGLPETFSAHDWENVVQNIQYVLRHDTWQGCGNYGKTWRTLFVQFQDPFHLDDPFTQSDVSRSRNPELNLAWYIGTASPVMWNRGLAIAYPGEASVSTTPHCPAPRGETQHLAEVRPELSPPRSGTTGISVEIPVKAPFPCHQTARPPFFPLDAPGHPRFPPPPSDTNDLLGHQQGSIGKAALAMSTGKGISKAALVDSAVQEIAAPPKPHILAMSSGMPREEFRARLAAQFHAAVEDRISALERNLQGQHEEIVDLREQVEHLQGRLTPSLGV